MIFFSSIMPLPPPPPSVVLLFLPVVGDVFLCFLFLVHGKLLGVCVCLFLSDFGGTASDSCDRWALAAATFFCWGRGGLRSTLASQVLLQDCRSVMELFKG